MKVETSAERLSEFVPESSMTQNWIVRKPAAHGRKGLVVSQSHAVSEIGVAVLGAGGTAADAAVAMAFALSSAEPWNSGIGGVGFGLVRTPDGKVELLDFGPRAPGALSPSHFPLSGDTSPDIFGWPRVVDDRNVHGALSFCLPSAVAGYGLLHRKHGRLPREELLAPVVKLAQRGLVQDWFTTVKIAQSAAVLRRCEESARIYLPSGLPLIPPEQGNPGHRVQGQLAQTLERIRIDGYDDYYSGHLAEDLLRDAAECGALINREDLAQCDATLRPAESIAWGGKGRIFHTGGLTAAPTLVSILESMQGAATSSEPDADWFAKLGGVMRQAYARRLAGLGAAVDPIQAPRTCTTHLLAADSQGMVVSLTTTLLSLMGSGVILPRTGVLMNNGAMWFDPREGTPNSVAGGKRPLSNMLPVMFVGNDGRILAGGASGGRRILASVYQMLAFQLDFGMSLDAASHLPRIDVSGPNRIGADHRLPKEVIEALRKAGPTELVEHTAAPLNFACPSFLNIEGGAMQGISDCMTPWSAALAVY